MNGEARGEGLFAVKSLKRAHMALVAGAVAFALMAGGGPAVALTAPVFGESSSAQSLGSPRDVAVADFDQDGYEDVVSAVVDGGLEPDGIALSFGGTDPTLSEPVMVGAGAPTWSVLAADFDADGYIDVVASLAEGNGIVLLYGHGDGTFAEPVLHATGHAVRGLVLADLNADGWIDIVGTEPELPGVAVLTGGGGGFTVNEHQIAAVGYALEAAVGQLAGDDLPDVAVVDNFGAHAVVLENMGAGFSAVQTLGTGEQPRDIVVADFNGDGLDDIAASSSIASDVEVFLADGAGAFADAIVVSAGADSRTGAMVARDLDGDSDVDLLAANSSTGVLVALENDGSGRMRVIDGLPVASAPTALITGDPDNDGVVDVILADFGDACVRVVVSPQTLLPVPAPYRLPLPVPNTLETLEVAGSNRYETAIEASKLAFPDGTDHVVIASGENWPDAVTASALAGRLDAPLLLTRRDYLPDAVADEVRRLGSVDAIVVGGAAAVSGDVFDALQAIVDTGEVRRLAGPDRYATADAVAREVIALAGGTFDGRAFLATGLVFADALAVSPLANASGSPVFLTPPTGRSALAGAMTEGGVTDVVVLGGDAAVSPGVEAAMAVAYGAEHVCRIAGQNRYETAAAVASYGVDNDGLAWDGVGLATGADFPDALAGGTMLGSRGSVLLLTLPDQLSDAAARALAEHAGEVSTVVFLGSSAAIDSLTRSAAENALR